MCCGAYAQNVKKSPPPMGLKMTTKKAAEAKKNSKYGKAVSPFLQKTIDKAERQVAAQGKFLRNRVGKAMRVAAKKAPAAATVPDGMARITLNVEADWGDGSGYQLLLDADAKFYATTTLADIYDEVDYALPEDASLGGSVLLPGESGSVDIPGGVYDFYLFNPVGNQVYIATGGSFDDYNFKAGYEYVFTVVIDEIAGHDNTLITCDAPADISVTGIKAPVSGKGLGQETVTATVANVGDVAVSSFTATLVVDGGAPVTETVNYELAPGATYDYTFTAKADLSAAGAHTVAVTVDCPEDGLFGNNRVTATVYNIVPVPAPYVCEFDEEADVLEWTIIDVDEDDLTWEILPEEGYALITYGYSPLNDYLVTVNPVALNAGENKIVVDYNATYEGYYESFEILYGTTADVSQMKVLKSVENFTATAVDQKAIASIEVPEGGAEYYFAIHATSEAYQDGIIISRVEVSEGAFIGEPDLSVDKVILPISSGALGSSEPVSAVISNNGTADALNFSTQCLVNGSEYSNAYQPISIAAGETKTILISSGVDMSVEGLYTVGVRITDVTPADGQNDEVNTDNNYAEATVTHYSPADVPFTVDFADPAQRGDWASDDSWQYDGDFYNAMTCVGTTPLVSRGINLKAGKAYRLSYNYMAGMDFYGLLQIYEDYDIILGEEGTDPADWEVVEQFSQVYTNDVFTDNAVSFTVPSDGVYSLGFRQASPQATFYLARTSVTELAPYDVTVGGIIGMPSQLPKDQLNGLMVSVPVKNNGGEVVSGTVSVTFNGNAVGSATFTDLAIGASETVSVPITAQGLTTGSVSVAVEAVIDGQTDDNPADNTFTASMEITEEVYAYDHMTDDLYIEDNGIGIEGGGNVTAGIPFLINAKTTLKGVSVGWGVADGQQISLSVYKWDPTNLYQDGVVIVGDKVYTTTADQGTTVGQIDYMFDEAVTLEPGYYFIGVTYVGHALVVDGVAPGQLYLIDSETLGYPVAVDNSSLGFGTPPVRAILGGDPSGIGSVEAGAGASGIVYTESSKTLVATSSAGDISSLAVYSASGAQVGNVAGGAGECVFDASRLVPGVYVAKMTTADGTETSKFIVK